MFMSEYVFTDNDGVIHNLILKMCSPYSDGNIRLNMVDSNTNEYYCDLSVDTGVQHNNNIICVNTSELDDSVVDWMSTLGIGHVIPIGKVVFNGGFYPFFKLDNDFEKKID